jgi:hypothetical protein
MGNERNTEAACVYLFFNAKPKKVLPENTHVADKRGFTQDL